MWWFGTKISHLPEATGPFTPGCMDVMLDYKKEGISMRLYYPTEAKKNDPKNSSRWYPWIPDNDYVTGLAKMLMSPTFIVRAVCWWTASMIPVIYGGKPKVDQKLKCIVLSHGLGGYRSIYSNICCELASRGYLVTAMEHRDNSSCYTFYYKSKEDAQNGNRTHVEYEQFARGKNHFQQRKNQVEYRAKECSKALDFLIDLNNGNVPHNVIQDVPTRRKIDFRLEDLVGKLDLDCLTIGGHSFGAATALLTLSRRKEFKQGIALDPWMFPIKDHGLDQEIKEDFPLLFVNTQTFHIASNIEAMSKFWGDDYEHRQMYTILHTTHEHQTDTPLLVGCWMNWFMKKLPPLVALQINNSIILGFLDKYVGSPCDIEDCKYVLEEEKNNFREGLTKAWV